MDTSAQPQLAPPGAGLPPVELFFARLIFRTFLWRGNRDRFTARFQQERQRIRGLIATCDAEAGALQILIPRPRGLEDSSRHWSVWMTLEHLRLMHGSIRKVMIALIRGMSLEGKASTASVKPAPGIQADVITAYEESCDDLVATMEKMKEPRTALTFQHPWFGALDALGWYAMAAFHLSLHRAQIERIIERLPRA